MPDRANPHKRGRLPAHCNRRTCCQEGSADIWEARACHFRLDDHHSGCGADAAGRTCGRSHGAGRTEDRGNADGE
jgi:hypothetical protein